MAINLRSFYDRTVAADGEVQVLSKKISDLFDANDDAKEKEAEALRPQLADLLAKAKKANEMYISMKEASQGTGENISDRFIPAGGTPAPEQPKELKDVLASPEYFRTFFNALKKGVSLHSLANGQHRPEVYNILMEARRMSNAMSGDGGDPAGEEGGFLQPTDFDNKIHELQRAMIDWSTYMNVENVNTLTGWRAVEQAAVTTGLSALTPQVTGAIPEITGEPKFDKLEFTLADYAGFLPISNDLLADTPIALMNYIAKFFAKKEVITNNVLIRAIIEAVTTPGNTTLAGMEDAMRLALNSTLDPAISLQATIFTDSTGFDLMDQLEDGQGRPFLQPDPTQPTLLRYKGRPIVRFSDAMWPLISSRAPVAIGWGQEFCTYFRKNGLQYDSTPVGGNAWRYNNTEVRGIMRAVAKQVDASAMVLLKVATA